jgi:hypothetical protein
VAKWFCIRATKYVTRSFTVAGAVLAWHLQNRIRTNFPINPEPERLREPVVHNLLSDFSNAAESTVFYNTRQIQGVINCRFMLRKVAVDDGNAQHKVNA